MYRETDSGANINAMVFTAGTWTGRQNQTEFLIKSKCSLHACVRCSMSFNIFMIGALARDVLGSCCTGFSPPGGICSTPPGVPDNDAVVWFINIGCLVRRVSRFDLPSIKFLMYY